MRIIKNKRQANRYPTACSIEFDSGKGLTRNLSTKGVCFTTHQAIAPDVMVRCFITMQRPNRKLTRLRCEGRVVRTTKCTDGWEVAVHFSTLEW